MYTLLYIIIAVVIAIVAAWIAARYTRKTAELKEDNLSNEIATLRDELTKRDGDISQLNASLAQTEQEREQIRNEKTAAETELRVTIRQAAETEKKLDNIEEERKQLQTDRDTLKKEVEMLRQQAAETEKRLAEMIETTKKELTNTTHELLKQRTDDLEKRNSKSMDDIVSPLREKIEKLQDLVHESEKNSADITARVEEQIKNMMERTQEIGNEATRLTKALTHNTKFQGSMGEQVLGNILDSAGLREGRDYEMQATLTTSTGQAIRNEDSGSYMRPDVILHFPDKRDVIIDSKVSLTAYEEYVNAQNDNDRTMFLKRHVDSMRKHVDELARKNYSQYVAEPHTTVDFVIMFVPFESAFQAAMHADPQLWQYGFGKKICIAGELNLTVILHMIHMSWTQFEQTQNQKRVFDAANELIKRVGRLYKRYVELGDSIDKVQKKYSECSKSITGTQGIVPAARRIVSYGAKDDDRLPHSSDLLLDDDLDANGTTGDA